MLSMISNAYACEKSDGVAFGKPKAFHISHTSHETSTTFLTCFVTGGHHRPGLGPLILSNMPAVPECHGAQVSRTQGMFRLDKIPNFFKTAPSSFLAAAFCGNGEILVKDRILHSVKSPLP